MTTDEKLDAVLERLDMLVLIAYTTGTRLGVPDFLMEHLDLMSDEIAGKYWEAAPKDKTP